LLFVSSSAFAANKYQSNILKQDLKKPAAFGETVINIGKTHCYISSSTLLPSGEENYGFNFGDDTAGQPSMDWLEGGYTNNGYLYFGVHRMSVGGEEIHFSGLNQDDWQVLQNDPSAKSAFQISYSLDDVLAGNYSKNFSATTTIHAWSEGYRDDFYIMEYDVTNGGEEVTDFYAVAS
jgi:hypothetical protein